MNLVAELGLRIIKAHLWGIAEVAKKVVKY
jgi:hypothetical protein